MFTTQQWSGISRWLRPRLGPFLARACELTGMDVALPANGGAEAVETAIKAARKWAYKVKGVPHDRAEIIAAEDNFHGHTITIVAFSSQRVIFYVADVDALYDRALVSGYQPATVPLIDPDGHGPAIPRGVGRAYGAPIIR